MCKFASLGDAGFKGACKNHWGVSRCRRLVCVYNVVRDTAGGSVVKLGNALCKTRFKTQLS